METFKEMFEILKFEKSNLRYLRQHRVEYVCVTNTTVIYRSQQAYVGIVLKNSVTKNVWRFIIRGVAFGIQYTMGRENTILNSRRFLQTGLLVGWILL